MYIFNKGGFIINICDLKNGEKVNIVISTEAFFEQQTYTKHSVCKINDEIYLLFEMTYLNGKNIKILNKIKRICAYHKESNMFVIQDDTIVIGKSLKGEYDNGLSFHFENVISIQVDVLRKEDFTFIRTQI